MAVYTQRQRQMLEDAQGRVSEREGENEQANYNVSKSS